MDIKAILINTVVTMAAIYVVKKFATMYNVPVLKEISEGV